ncbi:MAG: phosphatidylglycerophosphatase A [Candidatus Omnitrophica bacterium CG11_big_fil_rev_8_21_14_0_20_42_13]|uniref:Phosphatidylglycerophosphatase A n=1 Tax=Candidatus Ghiorseimicrobium undicola TaxID=1974746 RepID=A0A2H0LWU1_9BACT|nr:MAG: phosphatidylglycerophosphatase A [Candidatus Omnitrophica bacterium CG11_big_fil_rev_8_21_14_0_20_42_13]
MNSKEKLIKYSAIFFGLGHLPASGTAASIVALIIYLFIRGNYLCYILATLLFLLAAFLVSGKAEKLLGKKDSSHIVLDEMAGMFIAFMFLPFKWAYVVSGFILFRFFDIVKVWPMRKVEALGGSAGVVLDDVLAALYTNVILQLLSAANILG